MNRYLLVAPAAEQDILLGYRWYEARSKGLGTRFLEELDTLFDRILENPKLYRETIPGLHRSVTKTFPYLVFYAFESNTVHVLAVVHAAQNPGYIEQRLGS